MKPSGTKITLFLPVEAALANRFRFTLLTYKDRFNRIKDR